MEELLEPRSDRERLLMATARFRGITEASTILFNGSQDLPTAATKHIAKLRLEVENLADVGVEEMRTLTWSEFQKEKN